MINDLLEYIFIVILLWVVAFVAIVSAITSTVRLVKVRKQRKHLEEELRKTEARRLRRERMTTQEKIDVMKAYAEGKKIEWRTIDSPQKWVEWIYSDEPSWNWVVNDYRIKPEPTYRPYKDAEEMIEDFRKKVGMGYPKLFLPSVWVKRKDGGDFAKLITEFGYSCVWLSCSDIGTPMEKLFDDFTYLDGSPCGIKDE